MLEIAYGLSVYGELAWTAASVVIWLAREFGLAMPRTLA